MSKQREFIEAVLAADRIDVFMVNDECERHGACWQVTTKLSYARDEEGWLHRFGPRYTHLGLVEALDAIACWAAFTGTEVEQRNLRAIMPSLPLFEDELL
jgi:hypothetical protein